MSEQGQKLDTGKPPIDLIDVHFLEDVAQVLAFGARKYDLGQWKKGMALGKCLGGVLRHTFAMLRGEYLDPETGLPHAAHATCGLMFAHYYVRNGLTSVPDDRWKKPVVDEPKSRLLAMLEEERFAESQRTDAPLSKPQRKR